MLEVNLDRGHALPPYDRVCASIRHGYTRDELIQLIQSIG
jgi:hypothetical protein